MIPAEHPDRALPADLDALMVVHPRALSERALYNIDQFVLAGGPALIFVDPHAESLYQGVPLMDRLRMRKHTQSRLDPLFAAWGVAMVSEATADDGSPAAMVAGDRDAAMPRRAQRSAARRRVVPYPFWMALGRHSLAETDPITAELERIVMLAPGALRAAPGARTELSPLIRTGPNARLVPRESVSFAPDLEALLAGFEPDGRRHILAARLAGPAATAFPDGPPEGWAEGWRAARRTAGGEADETDAEPPTPPAHIDSSTGAVRLILAADIDMLADRSWLARRGGVRVPIANNADFVLGAVDQLTGAGALAALRGRGVSDRRFTRLARMQARAERRWLAKEKEIEANLTQTRERLADFLDGAGRGERFVELTAEQQRQLAELEQRRADLRRERREVQVNLHADVRGLKSSLMLANSFMMPLLVAMLGFFVAWLRYMRRRRWAAKLPARAARTDAAATGQGG